MLSRISTNGLAALGALAAGMAADLGPARAGDVRHSRAKIERIAADLGYVPRVAFADGLRRTVEWSRGAK